MNLEIQTIVLDGEPFIERHLPIFEKLSIPWFWRVAEGAANNVHCTSWCKPQAPRLSFDGTCEYLNTLSTHPNVKTYRKPLWDGKVEMFNTMTADITEPSVLMLIDSDELWQTSQLEKIVTAFESKITAMQFRCRYFVGEDLITKGEHCYGDMDYEWWRAWRYVPGMRWVSHEPPLLNGTLHGIPYLKDETMEWFGKFDHYAYATEAQVRYKEAFYGYKGLLEGWRRLQEQRMFPVFLRDFFSHVTDNALVVRA